jgi:uncharacterized membrane protein YgcG
MNDPKKKSLKKTVREIEDDLDVEQDTVVDKILSILDDDDDDSDSSDDSDTDTDDSDDDFGGGDFGGGGSSDDW